MIEKSYFNSEDKNLYKTNFNRKDPAGINEVAEISNKKNLVYINEDIKMQSIKHITFKNNYIIFTWLRSEI